MHNKSVSITKQIHLTRRIPHTLILSGCLLALLLAGLLLEPTSPLHAATATNATCLTASAQQKAVLCTGTDPVTEGCAPGAKTIKVANIISNITAKVIGRLEIRHSAACNTYWGRVFAYQPGLVSQVSVDIDGWRPRTFQNNKNGGLVYSIMAYKDVIAIFGGFLDSNQTPIGNSVLSPHFTCLTAPGQNTQLKGDLCDYTDPIVERCVSTARTVKTVDILNNKQRVGRLEERFSVGCNTYWGRIFSYYPASYLQINTVTSIQEPGIPTTFPIYSQGVAVGNVVGGSEFYGEMMPLQLSTMNTSIVKLAKIVGEILDSSATIIGQAEIDPS